MNEKRDARESENQKNMMRLEHFFQMKSSYEEHLVSPRKSWWGVNFEAAIRFRMCFMLADRIGFFWKNSA